MPRVIERPRKFNCLFGTCKRNFGSDSDRQRHQRIHTGEKPFVCDVCFKGFPQRTGLNTHRNIHYGRKPHRCGWCDQAFADPSSKARHEKETHRCVGTYKCPAVDCPVGIKRRSAFVVHLKEKHNLTKEDVNIDACAPPLLPKMPRKERNKRKLYAPSTPSDVSDRPGVNRIGSGRAMLHPPIALPTVSLFGVSDASRKRHSEIEERWFEPEHVRQASKGEFWDLNSGNGFNYGDIPDSPFTAAPSYSAALRDTPDAAPSYSATTLPDAPAPSYSATLPHTPDAAPSYSATLPDAPDAAPSYSATVSGSLDPSYPVMVSGTPDAAPSYQYPYAGVSGNATYTLHPALNNSAPPDDPYTTSPAPRYQPTRMMVPIGPYITNGMIDSRPMTPIQGLQLVSYYDGSMDAYQN